MRGYGRGYGRGYDRGRRGRSCRRVLFGPSGEGAPVATEEGDPRGGGQHGGKRERRGKSDRTQWTHGVPSSAQGRPGDERRWRALARGTLPHGPSRFFRRRRRLGSLTVSPHWISVHGSDRRRPGALMRLPAAVAHRSHPDPRSHASEIEKRHDFATPVLRPSCCLRQRDRLCPVDA